MLNIVIPMAGRGSRFAAVGYVDPKPLIPVAGRPMIQWVVENVRPNCAHRFIFICLAEHLIKFPNVTNTLLRMCPGCEVVSVDGVTQGAACTVLLARNLINNNDPLMIANSDQFISGGIKDYLQYTSESSAGGLILTFKSTHPKWSYCRKNDRGEVCEVVEKQVISDEATVGIYNFRHGSDFVRSAESMISKNIRINSEFYVAPAYNEFIISGGCVMTYNIDSHGGKMYGLGEPGDLAYFVSHIEQNGTI